MNTDQQVYIDTVRDQIKAGIYGRLLSGMTELAVVLDIGANIGLVSQYFHRYSKKVVAIEPDPETFQILKNNTELFSTIECHQVALAPKDGSVDFYVNDINFTASSTVNTYGKKIVVEGRKLTTILKDYNLTHVDVAKIDAEGAEGESLDYYQLDFAKDIIKTYYIEVHNCPVSSWEHKLGTLVGNFARCGYMKMTINGMSITATK